MLTVIYKRSGCLDIRYFKDKKEFEEWLKRQFAINPDTKIIETKNEP